MTTWLRKGCYLLLSLSISRYLKLTCTTGSLTIASNPTLFPGTRANTSLHKALIFGMGITLGLQWRYRSVVSQLTGNSTVCSTAFTDPLYRGTTGHRRESVSMPWSTCKSNVCLTDDSKETSDFCFSGPLSGGPMVTGRKAFRWHTHIMIFRFACCPWSLSGVLQVENICNRFVADTDSVDILCSKIYQMKVYVITIIIWYFASKI